MIAALTIPIDLSVLFGVAWWVYNKQPEPIKFFYWPALGFKLLAGLAVGWLYFYHYGQGDTIFYWLDGKVLAEKIMSDPGGAWNFYWEENADLQLISDVVNDKPRSLFFVKIIGVLALICVGNYWMMSGIISFLSFLGAWYLFKKILHSFPSSRQAAAISFLFYPSVVFWSSGIIKESLGLSALFFLAGVFLTFITNEKISSWEWIVGVLSLWIGWNLKYYWIGVLMPVAITSVVVSLLKRGRPRMVRFELMIWIGLFIIFLSVATGIHPNFYPHRFLEVIVQNNQEFMALTDPKNAVHYRDLQATASSVIANSPKALVAGLFRPFVWEAHNLLSLTAGLENFMLLLLVLSALPSLIKFFKAPHRLLGFAMITYIIILATFLALSTPNLGTLSRYKVGFLPFLVFLILYKNPLIVWWNNLKGFTKVIK